MPSEKGLRPTSPVHVHVEDDVPVHVHVKQPKKKGRPSSAKSAGYNTRPGRPGFQKSTLSSKARARSKSPSSPWVPAPGKATKGSKVAWQGPSHRLEIHTPRDALRMSDLSTDEEDHVHHQMKGYEHKIENLMTEMGTLKNEMDLQKTLREVEKKDEALDASRRVMEEQELELQEYKDELSTTERENRLLRKSMDMLREEADVSRVEADILNREREKLMKKLIEAEMDGQAVGKQTSDLRDLVRKMRQEMRISSGDSARLGKQKDMLLEKLADFEATNRTLRRLLREQHRQETAALHLSEQRDILVKKLADSDITNERMRSELIDRDRMVAELRNQITSLKEETMAMTGLQSSLENTRAHLQKQLRVKEADCNRMAVQVRTLESDNAQMKIENDHLREVVATAKDKAERDKEALKKATRVQKQRATQSEDRAEQLGAELMEKEANMEDLRSQFEQMRIRYDKTMKEKSQSEAENTALKTRMEELESLLERVDHNSKSQVEELVAKLHGKTSEVSGLQLENERLKSSIATIETKFKQADEELLQLRANLKQYEGLVEEYKSQINQSRKEADETIVQLEDTKRENGRLKREGEDELEKALGSKSNRSRSSFKQPAQKYMSGLADAKVKNRLHDRLQELEPLPEMLKSTELQLHDSQDRLLVSERKNTENAKLISELSAKVESLSDAMDAMRQKYHGSQDDNRSMIGQMDTLERRLQEAEDQNRELLAKVAKREEALHQNNLRLEERARENASLTHQLENALTDIRRQQEQSRDKQATKERTLQTRIVDLESQLSQLRAEIARIKREKEENERKFNSRLYDLKDRLEQSHSTNRSMQNYVQFLKNSYANVFGDSSVGMMPPSPIRSGFP